MANIVNVANGAYLNIRLITERLGGDFTNVKKNGLIDFESAVAIDANIVSTHANIYSDLPPGTPRSAQELDYVAVTLADGKTKRALALPWIEQDVTVIERVIAKASIYLDNVGELERLRRHLIAGGFSINSLEV